MQKKNCYFISQKRAIDSRNNGMDNDRGVDGDNSTNSDEGAWYSNDGKICKQHFILKNLNLGFGCL